MREAARTVDYRGALIAKSWVTSINLIFVRPGFKHAGAGPEVSKGKVHRVDSIAYGCSASIRNAYPVLRARRISANGG